ncbi:hypothetical protein AOLI_G00221990 [Acnodon oligacanthus]
MTFNPLWECTCVLSVPGPHGRLRRSPGTTRRCPRRSILRAGAPQLPLHCRPLRRRSFSAADRRGRTSVHSSERERGCASQSTRLKRQSAETPNRDLHPENAAPAIPLPDRTSAPSALELNRLRGRSTAALQRRQDERGWCSSPAPHGRTKALKQQQQQQQQRITYTHLSARSSSAPPWRIRGCASRDPEPNPRRSRLLSPKLSNRERLAL